LVSNMLLSNTRKTDSLPAAKSAEFLYGLAPPEAAFALLSNTRTTDSVRRYGTVCSFMVWRRASAACALLSNTRTTDPLRRYGTVCSFMVWRRASTACALLVSSLCLLVSAAGQTSGFRPADVRSDLPAVKPSPTERVVTPEMRGDIFMARKMYREAVDAYKSLGLTDPVLVNKAGIAYHQMLDLDSAKKYYEKAAKLKSDYAEAYNNLGTVHYARKSYRRAVSQYKKALRYSPNSASIHSNLGTAYFARKDYKGAMVEYETALSIDPEVFERRNSAGVLLQERAVEERAKFHYYQAKLYAKRGMNERALLCLRKAIEEGYKERAGMNEEPDFAGLKELPEFKEILAWQPRAL